jgi:hypothetical protein
MAELEDGLEAQPQRFLMLGITPDSYDSVIWVTSQFSGHLNGWWLNRKTQAAIPSTYNELVTELRNSTFLPNIKDDAIGWLSPCAKRRAFKGSTKPSKLALTLKN